MKDRQIVRVFLSSPADLEKERTYFPTVLEHVNKIKGALESLYFEPQTGKDTPPGVGRPQEFINKDIESADIFAMLLWKRWGTKTGKYSSGTQEEYELAKKLFKKNGTPEIWLYFRKPPPEMSKDPGPQLKNVYKFRDKVSKTHELLYRNYETLEEWKVKFEEDLCRWVDTHSQERLKHKLEDMIMWYTPEFGGVGGHLLWLGKHEKCLEYLEGIKEEFQHVKDKTCFGYFLLLYHLTVIHQHFANDKIAKELCEKALRIMETIPEADDEWKCKVLIRMHRSLREFGELTEAERMLAQAQHIDEKNNLKMISPMECVPVFVRIGTPKKLAEAERRTREFLQGKITKEEKAMALCQLGVIDFKKREYNRAKGFFEKSLSIYKQCRGSNVGALRCATHFFLLCKATNATRRQKELYKLINKITRRIGLESIDGIDIRREILEFYEGDEII